MQGPHLSKILTVTCAVLLCGWAGGCGGKASSSKCDSSDECPVGMFCETLVSGTCVDLECAEHTDCPLLYLCNAQGECYDPMQGTTSNCIPNHPGCACREVDLYLTINCPPPGQPAGVDKSCHTGLSTCDGERYGPCVDSYQDTCDGIHFGPHDFHPTDDNSENVVTGVEGELQLSPDERQVDFGFLWIANSGESTVSKIDVETGKEVARYAAALPIAGLPEGPIPYPAANPYEYVDCLHCPSRTAIDFNGDAFVANRALGTGAQGSVTKYANEGDNCLDLNNNGMIDTSYDANNDGVIDPDDPDEFLGADDECILWTVPVGNPGGKPRALAIDSGSIPDWGASGNVWVGIHDEGRAVQLNGDTGEEVVSVTLNDGNLAVNPYGAAVDALGFAWFTSIDQGTLAKVDTIGGNLVEIVNVGNGTGCAGAYGIAVDVKSRIWLAGWACNTAIRYDPADGTFGTIDFAGLGRGDTTRGIAPDLAGTVWVAHTDGFVTRFDAETLTELEAFAIPHHISGETVNSTIGVGIDRNGACWSLSQNINLDTNNPLLPGTATRITPGGSMDSFPTGIYPYTYSDFTGFGLLTVTRPSGWYNMIIAGCEDHDPAPPDVITDWRQLTWSELEPPDTNVRMRFKVADTVADLDDADWWGPYDAPDVDLDALGVPDANFMLLQVLLSSASLDVTPSFVGFDLSFDCASPIVPN